MALTQITRDSQIKPGTANSIVTNDASGKMTQTVVTANRALSTDVNGLPLASVTTAAQLAFLQDLTSLTIGDIIKISSGGNLQDAGISAANLFLADGTVAAAGAFNLGGFQINNIGAPTAANDAATKSYVDGLINGVTWKSAVQAATVANLTATYANGASGVGATLTNSGTQTALVIDGYTTSVNDRILVKNQTSSLQNGIYVVTNIGSGSTNWVLTRSSDFNIPSDIPAATVVVEEGSTNSDTAWICTTQPTVVIGTTAITFVSFGAVSTYTAGSGLDLTGNVFSISTDNSLTANSGGSVPSLVVKESVTGAITTVADGIAVSVDNSTIDISGNALEVKTGGITNTQISASAAIAFSKLASLTSANILVGNGSNVAASVAMTGDVSISNAGVTSISSGLATHFVTREVPSGTINSTNVTFTLANTPVVGTECIFLNGILQNSGGGNDYTISGATITFASAPETGSVILVNYQK